MFRFRQQVSVPLTVKLRFGASQTPSGILNRPVDLVQEFHHVLGPGLLVLFGRPFQFPQMMGIAQGVITTIVEIRFPVVVTEEALKPRQNPHLLYRVTAAFGVRIETGEFRVGHRVQPLTDTAHIDPGFIAMKQGRLPQLLLDPDLEPVQTLKRFFV